jgi:hypothetical protein
LNKIAAVSEPFAKLLLSLSGSSFMPSTFTLGMITLVIIGSFIISGFSYARQQALQKRRQIVRKLQLQADEALAYQSLLLRIDADYELLTVLQGIVVNALKKALAVSPDDNLLKQNLQAQQARLTEYNAHKRTNEIYCWGHSDAELSQGQMQLAQLSKQLDLFRNRGELSIAQHQNLQQHLKQLQLDFAVNSYLYQADIYAEQNNLASYQAYIRQAMQIIKKSDTEAEQKNNRIKALSERINEAKNTGRIQQLSPLIKPASNFEN